MPGTALPPLLKTRVIIYDVFGNASTVKACGDTLVDFFGKKQAKACRSSDLQANIFN